MNNTIKPQAACKGNRDNKLPFGIMTHSQNVGPVNFFVFFFADITSFQILFGSFLMFNEAL